jgi:hypothetical protein
MPATVCLAGADGCPPSAVAGCWPVVAAVGCGASGGSGGCSAGVLVGWTMVIEVMKMVVVIVLPLPACSST